jgi:2-dehydro-3-deoxyphosphogluconate aldolase / (4S)-4-hydroxy-2-oxoglutarate aldolase
VAELLRAGRLVPVATLADAAIAEPLASALLSGGLPVLEITFRTPAAADAIREARRIPDLTVGAGTVLSAAQAEAAAEAGAHFAVSPTTNPEVVERCRDLGLPFFPGAATPSEIEGARDLGAKTVKLFPAASLGGPDFVRAVSAIYPDMTFIPTGGIGCESLADYGALPSVLACAGSWIAADGLLRERKFDQVASLAREAVSLMS